MPSKKLNLETGDTALTKWIEENIFKSCWHELGNYEKNKGTPCLKCGQFFHFMWGGSAENINNYQYTVSLDSVSDVEKKVIEERGMELYMKYLFKRLYVDLSRELGHQPSFANVNERMVIATALQRARACRAAWESKVRKK